MKTNASTVSKPDNLTALSDAQLYLRHADAVSMHAKAVQAFGANSRGAKTLAAEKAALMAECKRRGRERGNNV